MKKNKGFTLIELLAVIVILAIIAIIAVPQIIGVVERARIGAAKASALGYIEAVEKVSMYDIFSETTTLTSGTYDVEDIKDIVKLKGEYPSSGTVTIDSKGIVTYALITIEGKEATYEDGVVTITGEEVVPVIYKEAILNGADPVIGDNMIPVTIADNGEVTYANLYSAWYSYENKEWANAVILIDSPSTTYEIGDTILESDIESYFVWIPRYRYQLFDLGNYTSAISSKVNDGSKAQSINIIFETKEDVTNDSIDGECTTPLTRGATGNCVVEDYMTIQAFISLYVN